MSEIDDPKFIAAIELLGRTGARKFKIGYSAEEDGPPVVWYANAIWSTGAEAAGAMHPVEAVLRLCAQVIDGGTCAHCKKVTIFDDNPGDTPVDALFDALGCVYAWDPELKTFRRGCE